ncbi:hypothetical protein PMZ80_010215 [Knufia obscura]|uniref:Uncharacterized protein n=2 Tax=Knufia TaxID=430999 RepID=A0AAN8I5H6_9EURO|nr:hypothetical protein PMZ80_010215 [Knufia obscura]KAK5952954.1 hypothetical protein OHC33_006075 [Knufia fluminis]
MINPKNCRPPPYWNFELWNDCFGSEPHKGWTSNPDRLKSDIFDANSRFNLALEAKIGGLGPLLRRLNDYGRDDTFWVLKDNQDFYHVYEEMYGSLQEFKEKITEDELVGRIIRGISIFDGWESGYLVNADSPAHPRFHDNQAAIQSRQQGESGESHESRKTRDLQQTGEGIGLAAYVHQQPSQRSRAVIC